MLTYLHYSSIAAGSPTVLCDCWNVWCCRNRLDPWRFGWTLGFTICFVVCALSCSPPTGTRSPSSTQGCRYDARWLTSYAPLLSCPSSSLSDTTQLAMLYSGQNISCLFKYFNYFIWTLIWGLHNMFNLENNIPLFTRIHVRAFLV